MKAGICYFAGLENSWPLPEGPSCSWLLPLMLAAYFIFHRQVQGDPAFCIFFFFEQFLPIAMYMADARAQELPLLTVGDADYVIHDWAYLFDKFCVLQHDIQIAHAFRVAGWIGMLATVAWM